MSLSPPARNSGVATGCALAGAFLVCILTVLFTYGPSWLVSAGDSPLGGAVLLLPLLPALPLGIYAPRWLGLAAVLAMTAVLQVGGLNPFMLVVPVGTWLAGRIFRDRLRLGVELARAGDQLEADTALLAEESVRYERARIARELHDIVAHCVSVTVIQSYAGERELRSDRAAAAVAFTDIAGAAAQARQEIRRLVELLAEEEPGQPEAGLAERIAGMLRSAQAAGIEVDLRSVGAIDAVPGAVAETGFRVVRESLTNALRHAPGSSIEVSVERAPEELRVAVSNTAPPAITHSGEPLHGLGSGIEGLRARVAGSGGWFAAGPRADGGWCSEAVLPLATTGGVAATASDPGIGAG